MKSNVHLLIIDPQNDFCDIPSAFLPFVSDGYSTRQLAPALPVPGADADMVRLGNFIKDVKSELSDITVTIDSHHRYDISHPTFWKQGDGKDVAPFTQITAADVLAGKYLTRREDALSRAIDYLTELEKSGRYTHMVWPVHCEEGSWGRNIHTSVQRACNAWEDLHLKPFNKVVKGMNPWTEHYSAVQAEVPDAADEESQVNQRLIDLLATADRILVAGEAGSHCVRSTVEHLLEQLNLRKNGKPVPQVTLLVDAMSPVAGFEAQFKDFLDDMVRPGVRLATTKDVRAQLLPAVYKIA